MAQALFVQVVDRAHPDFNRADCFVVPDVDATVAIDLKTIPWIAHKSTTQRGCVVQRLCDTHSKRFWDKE